MIILYRNNTNNLIIIIIIISFSFCFLKYIYLFCNNYCLFTRLSRRLKAPKTNSYHPCNVCMKLIKLVQSSKQQQKKKKKKDSNFTCIRNAMTW